MKIAILGAGVSGLALARFLVEGGVGAHQLSLFEAASVAGGLCRSKTVQGFTYDVAGGHILYSKDAHALGWMIEHSGGEDAYVKQPRNTRIRFEHRWVNYPFENGLGDLPPQANFECLKGYVEAWHARRVAQSSAPTEFGAWVKWRFGEGIARHFMDPYNAKVWKRDLDFLTSDWVAGRVPDAPVDDVLRASVGIRTEGYTHQSSFHYPKRGGFQAITDGLAATLERRIRLNTPVAELVKTKNGWRVNAEEFDVVVSTLSLTDLPRVVKGMPDAVARACTGLEYNGLVCILLALRRPAHPELSWIYLPHEIQGPANRVTYMSNYAKELAPPEHASLSCEITVQGGAPMPGTEVEQQTIDGLVRAGLLRRDEVLFTDRSEVRQAYVVFDHAYHDRRRVALGWLEDEDLIPLGRFGRFEYDNSDQCVIKARELAKKLLPRLARGA
ncbi:MAG: FAD-dependent oxidoreductase [Planctomycetota bacterium]